MDTKIIALSVSNSRLGKIKEILEPLISNGFYTNITNDAVDEILKSKDSKIILITGSSIATDRRHKIERGEGLISWANKNHSFINGIVISCLSIPLSPEYSVLQVEDPTSVDELPLITTVKSFLN